MAAGDFVWWDDPQYERTGYYILYSMINDEIAMLHDGTEVFVDELTLEY